MSDAHWITRPFAVIDFETTGLDAAEHRVVEMGIALFESGVFHIRHQWLIDPEMPIPAEATAVHGIGDLDVKDAAPFRALVLEVDALLQHRIPVAYNAPFDRSFLHAEFARAGIVPADDEAQPPALRPDVVWIDPLVWVRELQKYRKGKKLTDVTARMGIEHDAHRAGGDAEAAGRVLLALAPQMPRTYRETVRVQGEMAVRQDAEFQEWLSRQPARAAR